MMRASRSRKRCSRGSSSSKADIGKSSTKGGDGEGASGSDVTLMRAARARARKRGGCELAAAVDVLAAVRLEAATAGVTGA